MPTHSDAFANLKVFDHPLIRHKLAIARHRGTHSADFRRLLNEIAGLMTYEVSRRFDTRPIRVPTPLEETEGHQLSRPVTLVPILRAGLSMTDGVMQLFPEARVGHIGIRRDETTHRPVTYYAKLPHDVGEGYAIVIDPMLATGNSSAAAVDLIKQNGAKNIRFLCLLAAPEGIARMKAAHPDVPIVTASVDSHLNDHGYIVPGLGDAGDRMFGTK